MRVITVGGVNNFLTRLKTPATRCS